MFFWHPARFLSRDRERMASWITTLSLVMSPERKTDLIGSISENIIFLVIQVLFQHKLFCILSMHEVRYPCAVKRLVDASHRSLLLDTSLCATLLIHPCTMPWSRDHTWVIAHIDSSPLFADLFPRSCHGHTILVLAHLLFCWFSSNRLPYPASTLNLYRSLYFLSGEALAMWRLLDLSCGAIPWQHLCNSAHTLRSLSVERHVRAFGSTLWWHFFGTWSSATKKLPKTHEMLSLTRHHFYISRVSKFHGWCRKKGLTLIDVAFITS